jgi:hypothetical protein
MTRHTFLRWTCFLPLVLVALYEAPLHAYIDPGTGSMVLQGIIAAVAATAVTLRMSWSRIRGWFSRRTDASR